MFDKYKITHVITGDCIFLWSLVYLRLKVGNMWFLSCNLTWTVQAADVSSVDSVLFSVPVFCMDSQIIVSKFKNELSHFILPWLKFSL